MKLHGNPRTTRVTGGLLIARVRQQYWRVWAAASPQASATARVIMAPPRDAGPSALDDQSSAAAADPAGPRRGHCGRPVLAAACVADCNSAPSPRSTDSAILRRVGLNRLAALTPPARPCSAMSRVGSASWSCGHETARPHWRRRPPRSVGVVRT